MTGAKVMPTIRQPCLRSLRHSIYRLFPLAHGTGGRIQRFLLLSIVAKAPTENASASERRASSCRRQRPSRPY